MDCVPPCVSCNSFPNTTTEDETMIFNTTNSDKYMVVVKVFILLILFSLQNLLSFIAISLIAIIFICMYVSIDKMYMQHYI